MSDERIQPDRPGRPDGGRKQEKKPRDNEGDQAGGLDELPSFSRRKRRLQGDDVEDDAATGANELQSLGSLAQTARNKHLKQARNTLLIVGILMAAVQTLMFFAETGQVTQELKKSIQDPVQLKQAETTAMVFLFVFHAAAVGVGLILVVLAFLVQKFPVPTTVIALVLFLGMQLIFVLIDIRNIYLGWWIKLIVVVALVKALQAGLAAQKEARGMADLEFEQ